MRRIAQIIVIALALAVLLYAAAVACVSTGTGTAAAATTAEVINCGNVGVLCNGTDGDDTMYDGANTVDDMRGLGGNDALNGFGAADVLRGGSGRDQAAGGRGNDTIYGGDGSDYRLVGGCFYPACPPGRNKIYGGPGADTIGLDNGVAGELANGGLGQDTAYIDPGDTVTQVERCIVNGVQRSCAGYAA